MRSKNNNKTKTKNYSISTSLPSSLWYRSILTLPKYLQSFFFCIRYHPFSYHKHGKDVPTKKSMFSVKTCYYSGAFRRRIPNAGAVWPLQVNCVSSVPELRHTRTEGRRFAWFTCHQDLRRFSKRWSFLLWVDDCVVDGRVPFVFNLFVFGSLNEV